MSEPIHILIIDDMPEIRKILRLLLERKLNADIIEADSGLTGVEEFVRYKPDLVFCDLNMPEMTGLECLGFMTRQSHAEECRFVVLTTADDEETQVQVEDLSIQAFLRKPFDAANIEEKLRKLIPENYFL